MYKPKFTSILLLIIVLTGFKSDDVSSAFTNRLERAQMIFTRPEGFVDLPLVKNGQMNYEYAIKDVNRKFEIRYSIRPLDSLFKQFIEMQKNARPGDVSIGPNKLYYGGFLATMGNLAANGRIPSINAFPEQAVKSEFNADWGATGICSAAGEFGKGYKYCLAVAIHKDSLADAYIFYLTDSTAYFQTLLPTVFHALRFK